jgi:hypothetical protein
MTTDQTTSSNNDTLNEPEISLLDIVNFLQESWKKLVIAAIVGAVLGLSGWFFLGSYQAEYVLVNNISNNSHPLDLVSWKKIQKSLPNLAAQITDEGKAPEGQAVLYKTLGSEQWWQKNVVPSYALSKADTKDLATVSKDLDLASTTILSLTIKADGPTKEKSIVNVRAAANFLRTGSAYLQLRSILNGYESETISTVADLQNSITTTEIELGYQVQRAKALEDLYRRFPGGNNESNRVIDPKDSGAKYLPLSTQIIAVNSDINLSKQTLQRYSDRSKQISQIQIFLEEAIPLAEKIFDGILLCDELLAVESKLRVKLTKDDLKQQAIFDQLRSQLLSIKSQFTKSLEANTAPTSIKKGIIKTTAGGLAGTFFLMLLVLIGQRAWVSIKENRKSSGVQ